VTAMDRSARLMIFGILPSPGGLSVAAAQHTARESIPH
jgi:hypothetical protein